MEGLDTTDGARRKANEESQELSIRRSSWHIKLAETLGQKNFHFQIFGRCPREHSGCLWRGIFSVFRVQGEV